ncbi:NADPH2 dehydrogenase [Fusarium bulbicola]|nr:NADPH2 dehydrogenase [Fusarium bulbicola]
MPEEEFRETGFDGAEIQGGSDHWGDSIENRARFPLETFQANAQEVWSSKVAMRLSLWSDFTDNGMDDPTPTLTYIIQQLRTLKIEFLDLIEARFRGNDDADCGGDDDVSFAVHAWGKEAPVMSSRGFNGESAQKAIDDIYKDYKLLIVFGRHWTSNLICLSALRRIFLVRYPLGNRN